MGMALSIAGQQETEPEALLVTDDAFLRGILRQRLNEAGFDVQEALSVRRALAYLNAHAPLVVFLDLWIERGGGLRFLEEARETLVGRTLPVLLLGVEPRPEIRSRALELGARLLNPVGEPLGVCLERVFSGPRMSNAPIQLT